MRHAGEGIQHNESTRCAITDDVTGLNGGIKRPYFCRHAWRCALEEHTAVLTAASAFSARRERPPAPFLLRRLRRAGAGDGDSHPSERDGELDGGVA